MGYKNILSKMAKVVSTQSTWGESSAPRRPTHDTNTSRREVKITYTRQQHVIKAKQIQIHHEVY